MVDAVSSGSPGRSLSGNRTSDAEMIPGPYTTIAVEKFNQLLAVVRCLESHDDLSPFDKKALAALRKSEKTK